MKSFHQTNNRILAIAPSAKGFGFAVLEGQDSLVDWGVKSIKKDKNAESIKKVAMLIAHYVPDILVLQDANTKKSLRSPRIRELTKMLADLAKGQKIKVRLISRERVMNRFFEEEERTKFKLAHILAKRFPKELESSLPPKRVPWKSEDARMDIFDAVALALVDQRKWKV